MKSINAIKIIVVNLMSETSLRRVYIVGEVERFRLGVGVGEECLGFLGLF